MVFIVFRIQNIIVESHPNIFTYHHALLTALGRWQHLNLELLTWCQARTYSGLRGCHALRANFFSAIHANSLFLSARLFNLLYYRNPRRRIRCCSVTESSFSCYIPILALKIFMKSSLINRYSSTIMGTTPIFVGKILVLHPQKDF